MAKPLVTDARRQTRVPFLRGILTRSLQDLGLGFEEAYRLASEVREELDEVDEIEIDRLRELVCGLIEREFGADVARRYVTPTKSPRSVAVRSGDGTLTAFSRSLHQRHLRSCGLDAETALRVTGEVYGGVLAAGGAEIPSSEVSRLTRERLTASVGPEPARRYLAWTEFLRSGRPLLLLIGGTTGCGKSTVATEIAHHLEIVRVQSTDMLREVMRMMVPPRLIPALHVSSFDAWQALPAIRDESVDMDALIAHGFRSQADLVALPSEAVIGRALRERVSLIIEGIHVQPELMGRIEDREDAIVIMMMLSVLDPDMLKERIHGRSTRAPRRRARRYLRNFDSIWKLQSWLLSEADRCGVPIIANDQKERTLQRVMTTVIDEIERQSADSPAAGGEKRAGGKQAAPAPGSSRDGKVGKRSRNE